MDTHTFLWWITDSPDLSPRTRKVIADGSNEVFFSAASGWEIAIKAQRGKLTLQDKPEKFVVKQVTLNSFIPLPIELSHALHVFSLPDHHRDPFDRLLIAQSQLEDLPIITADPDIRKYKVKVIW